MWALCSSLPCLPGAAGGWGRCLPPEEVLLLHLAGEVYSAGKEKHVPRPAGRRALVSFVLLLLLCTAACTYLCRSAPGWGFWGAAGAASTPPLHSSCWRKGYQEHNLTFSRARSLPRSRVPSWKVQYSGPTSGQANAIQGEKEGNSAFLRLFFLSDLPLRSLCKKRWRSHVLMNTKPVRCLERSSFP